LADQCNAPADKSSVYIIYALKNGHIDLVYVGSTGYVKADGSLYTPIGGLKESITKDEQFGLPGYQSWKVVLRNQGIEALNVYWYVTHNSKFTRLSNASGSCAFKPLYRALRSFAGVEQTQLMLVETDLHLLRTIS
jgi:ABC-type phosphate/phosphonate transport system substrate-binding protein